MTSTTILLIDKTAPTFSSFSLAPNPTYGAVTVTVTVNGAVTLVAAAWPAASTGWARPLQRQAMARPLAERR